MSEPIRVPGAKPCLYHTPSSYYSMIARYWQAMQARPSFAAVDIWTKFHVLRLIGGIVGIAGG